LPEEPAYLLFGLLAPPTNIGWEKQIPNVEAGLRVIMITEYKRLPADIHERRNEGTY